MGWLGGGVASTRGAGRNDPPCLSFCRARRSTWETAAQRTVGGGLTGYSADGAERFHLFGDEAVSVAAVAGTYAYVSSPDLKRYRIVDTESGKVIANVQTARPTTLFATRPDF